MDFIASALGMARVGLIITQTPVEKEALGEGHTLATADVQRMAEMQALYGDRFVTAVVGMVQTEAGPHVHFEAFQASDQCTKLCAEGWFVPSDNPKVTRMKSPVMIAVKDVSEVDNDYFLVPLKILDHEGPLGSTFPIENRLLAQTAVRCSRCSTVAPIYPPSTRI